MLLALPISIVSAVPAALLAPTVGATMTGAVPLVQPTTMPSTEEKTGKDTLSSASTAMSPADLALMAANEALIAAKREKAKELLAEADAAEAAMTSRKTT